MPEDEVFEDDVKPTKDRESFVFDKELFKIAEEARQAILEEEIEKTKKEVGTVRH